MAERPGNKQSDRLNTEDLPPIDFNIEDERDTLDLPVDPGGDEASGDEREEARESLQDTVRAQLEEAIEFYEENIEPDQVEATDYYFGRPFGDEEEGRSKVVSTDLRDTVLSMIPSLMRIFLGPEKSVEFRGRSKEDARIAAQQTDYINYVIREDNSAFLTFNAVFKDALIRRLGVVKWFWDEFYRVEESQLTGLTPEDLQMIAADPEVEILENSIEINPDESLDVRIKRTKMHGCERYVAIPPEEFVFTPNARSIESAPLVAHVRYVPADELIAMGIDPDEVEEAVDDERSRSDESMSSARQFHGNVSDSKSESIDDSQRPVLFAEAWVLADADGDDIAERRLCQCIGPDFKIVNGDGLGEIVDEVPIAVGTPDPEGHTIMGLDTFDLTKEPQRVKSQLLRETLNSLGKAVEPVLEVVTKNVNMADVLNPDNKGIVRVKMPGMMREVAHAFVGPSTLPMLEYYDNKLESSTGRNKGAMGLDADALQSTTKPAVAAMLSASQQRIEMVARSFAETLFKPLFAGLLRLSVKHRSKARTVRLRNEWVEVDPRFWDATMDVHVNVGLGQGTPEDRIAILEKVAMELKEQGMAGSPLFSWVKYRNVLARILELGGYTNPDEFFNPFGPAEEQQMQQAAKNQPPPPDPAMALVEIEKQKLQMEGQVQMAKMQLEQWKAQREDDRERDKAARETQLKILELELKFQAQVEQARFKSQVERERAAMEDEQEHRRIDIEETQPAPVV
jgi:hypothetical protein